MEEVIWNGPQKGLEDFFLLIGTLRTCWAGRISILSIFWRFFVFQITGIRFPDASSNRRSLRSQLGPSPNSPRDGTRRKEPVLLPTHNDILSSSNISRPRWPNLHKNANVGQFVSLGGTPSGVRFFCRRPRVDTCISSVFVFVCNIELVENSPATKIDHM